MSWRHLTSEPSLGHSSVQIPRGEGVWGADYSLTGGDKPSVNPISLRINKCYCHKVQQRLINYAHYQAREGTREQIKEKQRQ